MDSPFLLEPEREVPPCPVCGGQTEVVYHRHGEIVAVCVECHTGLTIPRKAWQIAEVRKARLTDKPGEKAS